MHTLLLLLTLAQPVATETEVEGSPRWAQARLMSFDWSVGLGPIVRQRDRTLRLQEPDFAAAFALVPEARDLAVKAKASFDKGSGLVTAALVTLGIGGALTVGGSLSMSLSRPANGALPVVPWVLMGTGLATMLVGLVLELVGLEPLKGAQTNFFSAVATYNRGLLDPRPAPTVTVTP
jgi:hypothetical protein